MSLSVLLQSEHDDLRLLEAVGDALSEKADISSLGKAEQAVFSLWIYIAANPGWHPPPVDRSAVVSALIAIGRADLAGQVPSKLGSPDFATASPILESCVAYLRQNEAHFDLGPHVRLREPDGVLPLPLNQMAAIYRPKTENSFRFEVRH